MCIFQKKTELHHLNLEIVSVVYPSFKVNEKILTFMRNTEGVLGVIQQVITAVIVTKAFVIGEHVPANL